MLDNRSHFMYKNFSVPKDDPIHNAPNEKLLFEAIKRQIQLSHVVILMSGVYSTYLGVPHSSNRSFLKLRCFHD